MVLCFFFFLLLLLLAVLSSAQLVVPGLYSGAFGYLGYDGAVDLAMTIRSIVIDPAGATVGTGGRGELRAFETGDPTAQGEVPVGPFRPTVFLYDNYPGGIGLSAPLFQQAGEIVNRARSLVAGCPCRSGCPACVGPILATDESRGFSPKATALTVLDLLASEGPPA